MKVRYIVPALMALVGMIVIVTAILQLYKTMEIVIGISLIAFGLYLVISAVLLEIHHRKLHR